MNDETSVRIMRTQAWERAKGELRSMLCTYHSARIPSDEGKFEAMDEAIEAFVKQVEDEGLQE